MSQFSDKSDVKEAREKTYRLKLEFYNTDRKMKNINRRIFTSVIMHLIFMHFRKKISFKSALEIFTPVDPYWKKFINEYQNYTRTSMFYTGSDIFLTGARIILMLGY